MFIIIVVVCCPVETVSITAPDSRDPLWTQTPQTSAETEHTELSDSNLLVPVVQTSDVTPPAAADGTAPPLKVKQEEAEVEIVEVKQEHLEPSTSEGSGPNLLKDVGGAGLSVELPGPKQCMYVPGSSVTEHSVFMGVTPNTCKSFILIKSVYCTVYINMCGR